MSASGAPDTPPAPEQASPPDGTAASRKSYRRKYRKIMVTFEEKMRESTSLFKEEQRIQDISQRLAEQTDQLLQLLTELNACPQVPPRLRYDLESSPNHDPAAAPGLDVKTEDEGHLALRKARSQLQTGEIDLTRYREVEHSLLKSEAFAPKRSYVKLVAETHLPRPREKVKSGSEAAAGGFLSVGQEELYLDSLDAFLEGTATHPRSHAANGLGTRNAEKTTEREREMQLRNPVSVYNWLRKHQPQVFLQDNEAAAEKAARPAGSRSSARKSASKDVVKLEQDLYDDDGIASEVASSARGKRKRDDDGGYRPKGGNSRGTKRRKDPKEDSSGRNKRVKKLSMDAR
ncbi:hypothetical protein PV08_10552 [Exophiala spinifera]|uniref:Uncharacterized protein n=1 Tax=Exophiala spinifera TaxID=91928 RepID=A0A0D1ZE12_9EURO|nr:uncharacterized protein PV08_10552 [Exophiala spinifera]KIW11252.1 hypothetical protein PV08_10552 [Exophiala spinifera]